MSIFEITFLHAVVIISICWVVIRLFFAFRNKRVDWKRECLLLTVYMYYCSNKDRLFSVASCGWPYRNT